MLLTSWQHAYVNKLRLYPEKTCWPSLATERASTRARIADLGDPVEVRRQIPRSCVGTGLIASDVSPVHFATMTTPPTRPGGAHQYDGDAAGGDNRALASRLIAPVGEPAATVPARAPALSFSRDAFAGHFPSDAFEGLPHNSLTRSSAHPMTQTNGMDSLSTDDDARRRSRSAEPVRNRRAEIYQFPVSAGAEVSLNSTGRGRHITEMELGDADDMEEAMHAVHAAPEDTGELPPIVATMISPGPAFAAADKSFHTPGVPRATTPHEVTPEAWPPPPAGGARRDGTGMFTPTGGLPATSPVMPVAPGGWAVPHLPSPIFCISC